MWWGRRMGGVEEMQQRSQLSPGVVCVLDLFTRVHLCRPVCMHLMSQMLIAGVCALFSCVRVSSCDSVFNLFDIGPPAEGSESDIICALISESLCNDNSQ